MKSLRIIASLLVLGPVAGLIGTGYGKVKACRLMAKAEDLQAVMPELAGCIKVALFSMTIGTLCFLIGIATHWIIAKRTQVYPRHAWYLILVTSILFLLEFPNGTVLGGVTIVLLFTLQTFKKMRSVEPTGPPYGGSAGAPPPTVT